MYDALELIYKVYDGFLSWVFGSYLFSGVSFGMLFVSAFVFIVLLRFLVAIPRIHVGGGKRVKSSDE